MIDFLRAGDDLTTDFWEVFVVDPAHQPVGTCLLSWILRTPRRIAVADVMKREQTLIPVDMDQEEVALRFQKYALISAAVVDQAGPAGRHDHRRRHRPHHPGGSERGRPAALRRRARATSTSRSRDSYKARVRWLVANLGTALVASTIIGLFERGDRADGRARRADADRRRRSAAMPAPRRMAVTVRALATNQLTQSNTWRTILREIRVALLNGVTIARADRARRRPGLRQPAARRGDRGGDADQHRHRRPRRRARAGGAGAARRRTRRWPRRCS